MNETRKAIIELISNYMDKSLSEGCLVGFYIYKTDSYIYGKITDGGNITEDNIIYDIKNYPLHKDTQPRENESIVGGDKGYINEILGHYDITAVLKYFENEDGGSIILDGEKIILCPQNYGLLLENILNKPLHLYTEQEEILLLELLKKLGKN